MMKCVHKLQQKIFTNIYDLQQDPVNSQTFITIYLFTRSLFSLPFIIATHFEPSNKQVSLVARFFMEEVLSLTETPHTIILLVLVLLFWIFFFKKKENQDRLSQGITILQLLLLFFDSFSYFIIHELMESLIIALEKKDTPIIVMNFFNLISVVMFKIIYEMFYISNSFIIRNQLIRTMERASFWITVFSFTFCFYLPLRTNLISQTVPNEERMIIISMTVILVFLKIKKNIFEQYYHQLSVEKKHIFFVIFQSSFLIVLCIENIMHEINETNFLLLVLLVTFLGYQACIAYVLSEREDMHYISAHNTKDVHMACLYLNSLALLSNNENNLDQYSVIKASISKLHKLECEKPDCFCRESTKNFSISEFTKHYISQELCTLEQNFSTVSKVILKIMHIRFEKFNRFPQIFTKLELQENVMTTSVQEKFAFYCLRKSIKIYIKEHMDSTKPIKVEVALNLEDIKLHLATIIESDIESRYKKWKLLSRGFCRIEEIESECKLQLEMMRNVRKIHCSNNYEFKTSNEFNLLLYKYYSKVGLHEKLANSILEWIKPHDMKIKGINRKEFATHIFNKNSCILESPINVNSMGIISRATKNVDEIFGYEREKIIGMNVNTLMPTFMTFEHDKILNEWAETGTWNQVGEFKEIFCVHKREYCFSAVLYLKIMSTMKGAQFITLVYKKNDSDYMLINSEDKIEGIGSTFMNILGNNCKKLPATCIINDYFSIKDSHNKKHMTQFLSPKHHQSLTEAYMIDCFNAQNGSRTTELASQLREDLIAHNCQCLQISFQVHRLKMRSISYTIILILDYREILQSTENNARETLLVRSEAEFDDFDQQSADTKLFDVGISVKADSAEKENFTMNKTLARLLNSFESPQTINDPYIKRMTYFIVFMFFMFFCFFTALYTINRMSFEEINGIIIADSSISDSMQLTQILYNQALCLKLYERQPTEYESIKETTLISRLELYRLFTTDFRFLMANVTALRKDKYFIYLQKPVKWVKLDNSSIEIEVLQFLEFYFYLIGAIVEKIDAAVAIGQPYQFGNEMHLMYQNFPELKRINHYFLHLYDGLAEKTLNIMNILAYGYIALFMGLTMITSLYLNCYFKQRFKQYNFSMEIYRELPFSFIESMKDYYLALFEQMQSKKGSAKKMKLSTQEVVITDYRFESSYTTINKLKFVGRRTYYTYIIFLLVFILLNAAFITFIIEIKILFDPAYDMKYSLKALMSTENHLMESYFDLKTQYLYQQGRNMDQAYFTTLFENIRQQEVLFNKVAMDSISLVTKFDPTYKSDFINILSDNICETVKHNCNEAEKRKCREDFPYKILDNGVVNIINFFQRKTRQAFEDFYNNDIVNSGISMEQRTYFKNEQFLEMDYAMVYMLKIFQETQFRIYTSYQRMVTNLSETYLLISAIYLVILFILVIVWWRSIPYQLQLLGDLCGRYLLLPGILYKKTKNLLRIVENQGTCQSD